MTRIYRLFFGVQVLFSSAWPPGEGHGDQTHEIVLDATGCSTYNLQYPQRCEDECSLTARWFSEHNDTTDGVIHFNVTARTKGENVWVGIGFSENGKMVKDRH